MAPPLPPPLTSAQIRAARALIRWSAEDLARHTALSVTTIRRAELMPSTTALTRANDQAIRRALEQAGVEFIDAEKGGPGVRLRGAIRREVVFSAVATSAIHPRRTDTDVTALTWSKDQALAEHLKL